MTQEKVEACPISELTKGTLYLFLLAYYGALIVSITKRNTQDG